MKRLAIDPSTVVVVTRRPLAEAIMAGGFSGVELIAPEASES